TAANRRFTFDGSGNGVAARDHLGGLTAFGIALGLTTAAIAALHLAAPRATRPTELAVLVVANLMATVVRFLLLRMWIPPARPADRSAPQRPDRWTDRGDLDDANRRHRVAGPGCRRAPGRCDRGVYRAICPGPSQAAIPGGAGLAGHGQAAGFGRQAIPELVADPVDCPAQGII